MGAKAKAARWLRGSLVAGLALSVSGCVGATLPGGLRDAAVQAAVLEPRTGIGIDLAHLPRPRRKIDVSVYAYQDKTGQQKPQDTGSSFSKAVTQGGETILIDALADAGGGKWFNVVERASLANLLNERNIIDSSRRTYLREQRSSLSPLRFAGVLLEGGIIHYDSNTTTGGAGARYLGIGPSFQHRRDVVTVALRAVSVATGDVLASVTTSKTVYSVLAQGSVFKYVAIDEILEIDAGQSRNEPVGLAVRQAIELAVYALIIKGAKKGLWSFQDHALQQRLIDRYDNRYVHPRADNTQRRHAAARKRALAVRAEPGL